LEIKMNFLDSTFLSSAMFIAKGMGVTLKYAIFSVCIGLLVGLTIALMSQAKYKSLNRLAKIYVSIFRGTPLLIQLSLVYFAAPNVIGINLTAFTAGVIAFSLNSGAYLSEVFRAGIKSIDKGQHEAAIALHIPKFLMWRDILLPQALRNISPALANEFINMIKETAIISTIGELDIMRRAQLSAAEHYSYFEPLLIAGACYYTLIMGLTQLSHLLEKKLSHDHH
jgi:polar amino acid transport system permease protein